ncbi:TetR/AcrR family transcriptional regulator [Leptolyngbyaceae cyanobacterium CCMR0082]|uniref:TetR/AcrR family transcriptional regulator n=1 Tax=Adonisia turfae CCMR0082 TaxID=2304604 RepID=A0A6M0RZX9_9CYAN|nr:TetR/AcrR family transcriptional regulator [Adonisia turfae]NEZ61696.1 TetR/AcrR family transcriptional regulator [Adonisia turfae CCMR0082]
MATKKSYHHGDLRRALLDSALAIITEQDISALSLRQVARRAGVSHTAPYRHFADKEALLAAVAEEGFREFSRYLEQARDAESTPLAQLQATGIAYVEYALRYPTHYQVMFGSYCADADAFPLLTTTANKSFQILVDIIADGQAAQEMQPGEPQLLALANWSLVHGLAMLLLDNRLGIEGDAVKPLIENTLQLMQQGVAL